MGRGQGYCKTSYNAHDSPHNKDISPNVHGVEAQKFQAYFIFLWLLHLAHVEEGTRYHFQRRFSRRNWIFLLSTILGRKEEWGPGYREERTNPWEWGWCLQQDGTISAIWGGRIWSSPEEVLTTDISGLHFEVVLALYHTKYQSSFVKFQGLVNLGSFFFKDAI